VLQPETAKKRAEVMGKLIKLAHAMLELQNFNDALAIMAALDSAPIHRLKKTKAKLGNKEQGQFEVVSKALSQDGNNKAIRELLSTLSPPCVPYIGMFLSDLVFMADGNKDILKGYEDSSMCVINIEKRRKMAFVIRQIQQLQQGRYRYEKEESIQKLLEMLPRAFGRGDRSVKDREMYDLSLLREPRE